ncbi:MAG: DUF4340 domain-containing protein [Limisphaerales bacterium]
MSSRTTLILMLCAGALLAFIFFVEHPARQAREQSGNQFLFFDLNLTNVTAMQILPAGRYEIVAEKASDGWQLRKPIDYPANQEFIEALVTNLATLRWKTHITSEELRDRPNAQEEFGMATPQFALRIKMADSERHVLVGSKSVIGDEVFVQFVGGDGLYLVDSSWMNLLPSRPEDWKDPSVLPATITSATGIDVRAGNRSFKLEINPTNQLWRLMRPIEARANHPKVFSLLTNLLATDIVAYVSEEANLDLNLFGLPNTPGQTPLLELSFLNGTNLISGIQIGAPLTNSPEYVFARHLDRDTIFVVPKEPFDPWLAPHVEFRDRRLIRLASDRVESVEVRGSEEFAVKPLPGGKWQVSGKETFSADPDAVGDLLDVLSKVEIVFENDVVTDFSVYGLTNPIADLVVSGTMTNALLGKEEIIKEQLRFGTNGTNKVFVRRNEESRVYSIHPQEFALLPRNAWQMADKQVWNFAANEVVSVVVEQGGRIRKLLRRGENEWSIAPGSEGIVNPFLLEEAMHRLGKLQAVFWTARGELSGDPYGFEKNDLKITIELLRNGNIERLPLRFGDFSEFNQPFASTVLNGQPVVFEFSLPLYLEFVRRDLSIVPAPLPPY